MTVLTRRAPKKAPPSGYNSLKEFDGQRYTGMAVGRSHTWRYDPGEWKEKKITPEKWQFTYYYSAKSAGVS